MNVIHKKLLIWLMPTWGCEKDGGVGIKPYFYSSGYFNKTLSSSVLVTQTLLCVSAFKTHVHKGKPKNLCWVRTRIRCQPETAPREPPSRVWKKVHSRISLAFSFKAAGMWKGRIAVGSGCRGWGSKGQPVLWQAVRQQGASITSS